MRISAEKNKNKKGKRQGVPGEESYYFRCVTRKGLFEKLTFEFRLEEVKE